MSIFNSFLDRSKIGEDHTNLILGTFVELDVLSEGFTCFSNLNLLFFLLGEEMDSQRRAPGKYNKVNQQKKYHLLSLVYRKAIPLRDVPPFTPRPPK